MFAEKKKSFYVVWAGASTGVFHGWTSTEPLVKGFKGAKYAGFYSEDDANRAHADTYENYLLSKRLEQDQKRVRALAQAVTMEGLQKEEEEPVEVDWNDLPF